MARMTAFTTTCQFLAAYTENPGRNTHFLLRGESIAPRWHFEAAGIIAEVAYNYSGCNRMCTKLSLKPGPQGLTLKQI